MQRKHHSKSKSELSIPDMTEESHNHAASVSVPIIPFGPLALSHFVLIRGQQSDKLLANFPFWGKMNSHTQTHTHLLRIITYTQRAQGQSRCKSALTQCSMPHAHIDSSMSEQRQGCRGVKSFISVSAPSLFILHVPSVSISFLKSTHE